MNKMKLLPVLFLICLALCLLTGCGTEARETAPETELVYAADFHKIPLNKDRDLQPVCFTEDGFYASCEERLAVGEIPEGETPEYVGQYDSFGQKLYFVGLNGELRPLDYVLEASAKQEERKNYACSANIEILFPREDGRLALVERYYESWWDGPEGMLENDPAYYDYYQMADICKVTFLDENGAVLSSDPLEWEGGSDSVWLDWRSAVMDSGDRLIVPSNETTFVFSADGTLLQQIELNGWASQALLLPDGRVGIVGTDSRGSRIAILDLERGEVSESLSLQNWPDRCYTGAGEYDFYFTSGTKLYGYCISEKREELILNLLDCDLGAEGLLWLRAKEDGGFLCYCADQQELDQVEIKRTERSALQEKRVLTLGTFSPDEVSPLVLRFNRSHSDVRIQILDYSEAVSGVSDAEVIGEMNRINVQIMSGEMPDLLMLRGLPYEQLAAKGLLEDLYPYLDGDPVLQREDFLPSVLQAMEMNGKLYQIAPGFSIYTLLGSPDVVGTEPGWTIRELEEAADTMPEGCAILGPYSTRDQVLMEMMFAGMNDYVNWQEGRCDFDNEDFCELLRFCARFPAEVDPNGVYSSELMRIASGEQMLMENSIGSLEDLGYCDQYFGGACTYIGFPCRSGCGSYLQMRNSLGMSASCSDKEAGWEFLRMFLSEEYQSNQYGIPLRRDVFQSQLEDAMRIDYMMNEDGKYLLDENGQRIPISRGGMGMADESGGSISFEYYGLTREQADRFLALLELAEVLPGSTTEIFEIVNAEAAVFFAGDRSAEDTAKVIQSRVSLYLSEQG
jgi:hypothetical protein